MISKIRLSSLALVLLLAGCAGLLKTPYRRPELNTPTQWQHVSAAQSTVATSEWWKAFGDPQLDALVEQVLTRNNDLAAAGIQVRRAWLQAGLAADKQNPSLSANASASHSRKLSDEKPLSHSYSASASVSYEVDLWGRLARARDAAEWEAKATEEDRAYTAWALVATTTKLYWQIAYLNERITVGNVQGTA